MRKRTRRPKGPSKTPDRPPDGQIVTRRGPVLTVETADGPVDCVTRGRGKGAVVGDHVWLEPDDNEMANGIVTHIEPRRTELVRADAMGRRRQVLAANIDTVFIICAVEPPLRPGLIDRYQVAAHAQGLEAHIVFNKTDLLIEDDWEWVHETLAPYPPIGVPVHYASAVDGAGLETLQTALAERTSIFVGHSGVGKTSLLNSIMPGLGESVRELSMSSGRGTHTTTTSSLYHLPHGGHVIDSPGIRGFALWDMDPETLAQHFPDFTEPARRCRFANCRHLEEPQCGVKEAVEAETIADTRYDAYLRIRDSLLDGPDSVRFW